MSRILMLIALFGFCLGCAPKASTTESTGAAPAASETDAGSTEEAAAEEAPAEEGASEGEGSN